MVNRAIAAAPSNAANSSRQSRRRSAATTENANADNPARNERGTMNPPTAGSFCDGHANTAVENNQEPPNSANAPAQTACQDVMGRRRRVARSCCGVWVCMTLEAD